MGVNNKAVVQWFYDRQGKLTYSMTGSRNGSDGTADCSGSITQAIKDAGGAVYDYLFSTVTLSGYLAKNGYERISVNQDWNAELGDIVLMSWGADMSQSGGAGGHVGVMEDENNFISVDYWTGGQLGTAVSRHNWNSYYGVQKPNYIEVWRITGNTVAKPTPNTPSPKPTPPKVQNDVDYMRQHGYVVWNRIVIGVDDRGFVNGLWQVINNKLAGAQVTATISIEEWTNNGVPMAGISWADGTPNSSTGGGSFRFDQDTMAIVDYDVASNGIAVLVAGLKVWVDATFAKNA